MKNKNPVNRFTGLGVLEAIVISFLLILFLLSYCHSIDSYFKQKLELQLSSLGHKIIKLGHLNGLLYHLPY